MLTEQEFASLTVTTYEPDGNSEKIFELWNAPPFKLYVKSPVPPVAVTVIKPSLELWQETCDEPTAEAESKAGFEIIKEAVLAKQPFSSFTVIT